MAKITKGRLGTVHDRTYSPDYTMTLHPERSLLARSTVPPEVLNDPEFQKEVEAGNKEVMETLEREAARPEYFFDDDEEEK